MVLQLPCLALRQWAGKSKRAHTWYIKEKRLVQDATNLIFYNDKNLLAMADNRLSGANIGIIWVISKFSAHFFVFFSILSYLCAT
jgi:hypothetical protein